MTAKTKGIIVDVLRFIARHSFVFSVIAVVVLTSTSKALTSSVMTEIAGYSALAILIANVTLWAYSKKSYVDTDAQGSYFVQGCIVLGAFLLVAILGHGLYYAKQDGTVFSSSDTTTVRYAIPYNADTGRSAREDGTQ